MQLPIRDFHVGTAELLLRDPRSLLLDLRTAGEYCDGHLAAAILVPIALPLNEAQLRSQLWKLFHDKQRDTPIVLYCKRGKRAGAAKRILQSMGFAQVSVLGGVEVEPLRSLFAARTF